MYICKRIEIYPPRNQLDAAEKTTLIFIHNIKYAYSTKHQQNFG